MGKSYRLTRLESAPVDLLEVLDIDSRVVLMELQKWLIITCMVVQERRPPAVSHIRIRRIAFGIDFRIVPTTAALP